MNAALRRALRVGLVAGACAAAAGCGGAAAQPGGALDVVARAAEALGGRDRVLALRTLTIEGYGQLAYQNGGGNITSSPDAPQKWIDVNEYSRVVDLAEMRTRVRARRVHDFVFAASPFMRGVVSTQAADGDVGFTIGAGGAASRAAEATARAWRMEMLAHPVVSVRAALHPDAVVSNRRSERGLVLVDVTTALDDDLTLAVDDATSVPAWVSWVGPDTNLGDLTYRAAFTGYEPVGGVLMPMGINTTIDFRDVVQQKLYVDRHAVDAPVGDLAAPSSVRAASPPEPRTPVVEATEIGRGIWYLTGAGNSTLFEFEDHLTLFEVYGSEASTLAVIRKARSLVPGTPLTEAIVSHHHFDHTGGLRAAVAEGLTLITQRGNEAFLREVAGRSAARFPDALAKNPRPVAIRAVDDHLALRDASMEIDIYRVVANSHMADALMVYVPRDRLLVQGDLFDVSWEVYWWGSSYDDNLRYRNLQVDRDVPVHGRVLPLAEVRSGIEQQIRNAQALCAEVAAANLSMRGCPVKTTVDR